MPSSGRDKLLKRVANVRGVAAGGCRSGSYQSEEREGRGAQEADWREGLVERHTAFASPAHAPPCLYSQFPALL